MNNQVEANVEAKVATGIDKEIKKELKNEIRKKYGTIQNFCKIAELSYSKMNMFFAGRFKPESEEKMYSNIKILVDSLVNQMVKQIMTEEERKAIRGIMFSKFKNVRTFCLDHDEFSLTFVSKVINGQRRKKDKKYEHFLSVISQ